MGRYVTSVVTSASGKEVGAIETFMKNVQVPADYLPMDGLSYLWSDYPELEAATNLGLYVSCKASASYNNGLTHTGIYQGNLGAIVGSNRCTTTSSGYAINNGADIVLASVVDKLYNIGATNDLWAIGCSNNSSVKDDYFSGVVNTVLTQRNFSVIPGAPANGPNAFPIALTSSTVNNYILKASFSPNVADIYYGPVNSNTLTNTWGNANLVGYTGKGLIRAFVDGSIAVKEGSAYLISTINSDAAKVFRATTLDGVFSEVLNLPVNPNLPNDSSNVCFYLSYNATTDVFIAVPRLQKKTSSIFTNRFSDTTVTRLHMYSSNDNGATWIKGDLIEFSVQHEPQILSLVEGTWIMKDSAYSQPSVNQKDGDGFQRARADVYMIQIDDSGAPRKRKLVVELTNTTTIYNTSPGDSYNTPLITNTNGTFWLTSSVNSGRNQEYLINIAKARFYLPRLESMVNQSGSTTKSSLVPTNYAISPGMQLAIKVK